MREINKYIFPEICFVKENTIDEQLVHVLSEVIEVMQAKTKEHKFEEITDLRHSIETLVRIAERKGMDVENETERVVEKNADRGRYGISGSPCFGAWQRFSKTCDKCIERTKCFIKSTRRD